jgi:hypothetical protein
MYDIVTAIRKINSNAEVSCNAEDYNQINWLNGTAPISIEDIKAKQAELKIQYEAEKQTKIDAKASALAKLSALGLTEEEVQAIIK